MTTDDYRKRNFGEAACVVKRIRETHTHTHIRKEVDHWSDPLGTESQNMQLDIYIYIYNDPYIYICVCVFIYIGYGVHQLRLKCAQVHHQSAAGTFTRVPGRCLR